MTPWAKADPYEEWELCFEYYSQGAEEVEAEAGDSAMGVDDERLKMRDQRCSFWSEKEN